ncbi:hypothetical protein [Luteibacter sp. 3190]|uniref:hypothetical protein n=1 Tax=Luteibacter sp. 3190 TaxID=2817736 RepID=UPI00285FC298|nr:hypothetical protein [Luteibacter sp. 3190]MDR6937218.1 hypothetical protein [Luteibacter sp. 3190]
MYPIILAAATFAGIPPSVSPAAIEGFDSLTAQTIAVGEQITLPDFRIETPLGGKPAAIVAVADGDDIASGMAIGMPEDAPVAAVAIYFHYPQTWKRVDLGIVLPGSASSSAETVVMAYGRGNEHAWTVGLRHGANDMRQRIGLSTPDGAPIEKMVILLRDGAQIDNIEMR